MKKNIEKHYQEYEAEVNAVLYDPALEIHEKILKMMNIASQYTFEGGEDGEVHS